MHAIRYTHTVNKTRDIIVADTINDVQAVLDTQAIDVADDILVTNAVNDVQAVPNTQAIRYAQAVQKARHLLVADAIDDIHAVYNTDAIPIMHTVYPVYAITDNNRVGNRPAFIFLTNCSVLASCKNKSKGSA